MRCIPPRDRCADVSRAPRCTVLVGSPSSLCHGVAIIICMRIPQFTYLSVHCMQGHGIEQVAFQALEWVRQEAADAAGQESCGVAGPPLSKQLAQAACPLEACLDLQRERALCRLPCNVVRRGLTRGPAGCYQPFLLHLLHMHSGLSTPACLLTEQPLRVLSTADESQSGGAMHARACRAAAKKGVVKAGGRPCLTAGGRAATPAASPGPAGEAWQWARGDRGRGCVCAQAASEANEMEGAV